MVNIYNSRWERFAAHWLLFSTTCLFVSDLFCVIMLRLRHAVISTVNDRWERARRARHLGACSFPTVRDSLKERRATELAAGSESRLLCLDTEANQIFTFDPGQVTLTLRGASDVRGAGIMSVDVKKTAASLIAAAYVDGSLDASAQAGGTTQIDRLCALALGQTADPDAGLATLELEAMGRAAEISSLNKAAVSLAGITAVVTGLFTGIGFSSGDLDRMIRDHVAQGLIFLILSGVAILLGTFAFVINGSYSRLNLNLERGAVYVGIGCAAVAFWLVAWGLSQGASAATTPTISASFDRSATPSVLDVTVASSDVPNTDRIITTVWGDSQGKWNLLNHLSTGAASDGTANASVTVDNADSYTEIAVVASVSASDSTPPASPTALCPSGTSCVTLFKGLATSSSSVSTSSSS